MSTNPEKYDKKPELANNLLPISSVLQYLQLPRETELMALFFPDNKTSLKREDLLVDEICAASLNQVMIQPQQIHHLQIELNRSCDRFNMDKNILINVMPEQHYQASMTTNHLDGHKILNISSGILKDFTHSELLFVIGHELAHHYYEHAKTRRQIDEYYPSLADHEIRKLQLLSLNRYQEASCDRFALLFCGHLSAAIDAITKVTLQSALLLNTDNGTDTKNLPQFQFFDIEWDAYEPWLSSHPPYLIRMQLLRACEPLLSSINKKLSVDINLIESINAASNALLDRLELDQLKENQQNVQLFYQHLYRLAHYVLPNATKTSQAWQLLVGQCGQGAVSGHSINNTFEFFVHHASRGRRIRALQFITALAACEKETRFSTDLPALIQQLHLPKKVYSTLIQHYLKIRQ